MRRIHKIYAVSIVPPAKKFLWNTVTVSWRCSVLFCFSDSYCCGALLLTVTGHLYQYNSLSHTLVPLSLRSLTTKLTPYELQLFTDQQLMTLSNDLQKPAPHIYGLGTSVFDQKNDSFNYLGTMIFLYSTAELQQSSFQRRPAKRTAPLP